MEQTFKTIAAVVARGNEGARPSRLPTVLLGVNNAAQELEVTATIYTDNRDVDYRGLGVTH
jgi:hypothetical protein